MKSKRELVEKITIKEDGSKQTSQKNPSVKTKRQASKILIQKIDDFEKIEGYDVQEQKEVIQEGNNQEKKLEIVQKTQQNPKNLQQSIIHDLKNNLSEISASVSTIKSQYSALRQSQSQILLNIKTSKPKTKKLSKLDHPEIVSFLTKKQQQQEQRERRRLNQIAEIEKKRRIEEQNKLKQKQDQRAGKINEIKKMWFVKEKNIKKKQEQEAKQKHVDEIYQKYRNMIPLFQIKEKRDKEDEIQRAEFVKQYLKKHKEIYMSSNQPYQQKQLTEHQKRYQEKSQLLQKQINEEKMEIFQKIQQDNEALRNLYRGKMTERVVSEMKINEQKKQIPFRIRQRMKGYEQIVKQNHLAKRKKSKLRQMRSNSSSLDMKAKRDNDSNLSFREIKRYKYLHGVSYGSVIERRPMAKSFDEERRVGKGYLEFMKSLPKKKTEKCSSVTTPIKLLPKPNPLLHNRPKNSYVDINDEPTRQEIQLVLQQLRANDKKIQNRQKMVSMKSNIDQKNQDRSQINNQILLSVQKKLNLLHKLESNKLEAK